MFPCLCMTTFSLTVYENPLRTIIRRTDISIYRCWPLLVARVIFFLESWLATVFSFPRKCSGTTLMLNWTTKNHMHRSKYINTASLHDPLLIAVTTLRLSLFTNMSVLASWYAHATIVNTTGISSLAIIALSLHSLGHYNCNHLWLNTAPHSPRILQASIWIKITGTVAIRITQDTEAITIMNKCIAPHQAFCCIHSANKCPPTSYHLWCMLQ